LKEKNENYYYYDNEYKNYRRINIYLNNINIITSIFDDIIIDTNTVTNINTNSNANINMEIIIDDNMNHTTQNLINKYIITQDKYQFLINTIHVANINCAIS
jgi:hypothetical protein